MFPNGFIWGAASSAYQVEGAAATDGRGPSVWDDFCKQPGKVYRGNTGDVACDHYHRFLDDIALMKKMGVQAYRFSVSWTRIMPDGEGPVNEKGLAFYDKLVDALLDAGIQPWLTLFHWDYPHALFARGGWMNADSPKWFADYATVVVKRLSDRVRHWMTLNEPQVFFGLGHKDGTHAPGLKLPNKEWLLGAHRALLAHGMSVQVIRANAKKPGKIGWAPVGKVEYPATETPANIEIARRTTMSVRNADSWNNTWWADPVCLGHYPEDGLKLFGADAPHVASGDMEIIKQPIDFYGLNIYSGEPVEDDGKGGAKFVGWPDGNPTTSFRWNVAPKSLYWGPKFIYERYKLPVVITENGMANLDWVTPDGKVHDPQRIEFTRQYLRELARASSDGVPVQGYLHWSILDNFEWAEGYRERFGLIHVDYATQKRTLKDSALWYADVIKSNGQSLVATAAPKPVSIVEPRTVKETVR